MAKGKEAGRIQVYVRVRPFTDKEKEKKEPNAIALHHDHSLIRVLDPRRETNYFFDGVFGPEASNYEVYLKVGRPLVYAALNGYKGTLLTYGQTGTGKTYTLLSEDGVTTNVVGHCFERIHDDEIHSYKVTCSFLQVYQEKVYDLLNTRFTVELPVREHPKKGVYVANLTQNEVKSASDVLALLEYGKRQLVMAETKMVRHSSRSHSIMQLIIERRLKAHIAMEQASVEDLGPKSPENVLDSIMAVDETINNLLKELKQERKSHHRRERECLKELMEKELDDSHSFKGDVIVKGKINLCDLAGSERLTKTKAEGVRLTEAKYLNTSLLELGNVIHALARGKQRHVPYRNSTLTRLLQDCLGDNGKTNFIVCIAPSLSEVNETKCSLNFGLRAMRIINVARLNIEMDYKVLAERLAKKLEDQDHRHKLEKLEYLREIQRLNTAVTSYEENEHVVNSDTDTLVSVIQNLSKSVQREKEAKHNLQSELTCLKKKVSNSPTTTAPDIEALFLAELMSMQLLTHVYQSEAVLNAVSKSDLPSKVKDYMTSSSTQENILFNIGYMLQLLDSCLGFAELEDNDSKAHQKEHRPKLPRAEQSTNDLCKEEQPSTKKHSSYVQNMTGGLKKMFGLLVGNKDVVKTDVCGTKSQNAGLRTDPDNTSHGSSGIDRVENTSHLSETKQTMNKLVHTKENVEKHIANLLLKAFGEQLICSQGNSPQWGVLGRKLSELILFKRNNIIGIKDTEMWSNYENVANILESCFKYVLIDKALLASMIVIEHMAGHGTIHKHLNRHASPERTLRLKTFQDDLEVIQKSVTQGMNSRDTQDSSTSQGMYDEQESLSKLDKSMDGPASPNQQRLKGSNTTTMEQEINDVFDDTSRLETELFATMEEKARLEDELIAMKEYVNRLKSDMFHLKIERANLESDFKKTTKNVASLSETTSNGPQKEYINNAQLEDYSGLRAGELSDVTEASHECTSGAESENGSHMSEGNEQGSQVLKNCLASMAQMYSLMPNPDDDTLTEGEDSDGKENASLSEDDIADSDEDDIIITKIAREMQDYHSPSSSNKVKKPADLSKDQSKNREKREKIDLLSKTETNSKGMKSLKNAIMDTMDVQKPNKTLKNLQIAYEDLEDELYHVRGQLSKAQQLILSLESQLTEEKANWEKIRNLYLENKDKNDVLEGKVAILREELEKSLRENTFLKDYHKVEVVEEGQNKTYGNSIKSPQKSPSRRKVFDLRSIPSIQNSNREMQIIKLLEENTELRTKNEKLSEEKMLAEHHSREKESKCREMEKTVRCIEEEKVSLKEEIEALRRRKEKLGNELLERREESVINSTELGLYSKESARLEKELTMERTMATKLRNDNSRLTKNLRMLETELDSWRRKEILRKQDKDVEYGFPSVKTNERDKTEVLQMVFIDDSCSEEEGRKREFINTDSLKNSEEFKTVAKLQSEIRSMTEYHATLEKEYAEIRNEAEKLRSDSQTKDEDIKSLENEIMNLRKQSNTTKTSSDHSKTIFGRLHIRTSPSKTKSPKEEFDVEERTDASCIHGRDYKNIDDEFYAVKRENTELRQQNNNIKQKIAIYEADLEKAMLKIKQLQEARVNQCIPGTHSVDKYIDPNSAPREMFDREYRSFAGENNSSVTEIKLTKASEEIERLREELVDKEAEKRLLYDELHLIRKRKDELDKALDEAREARSALQEKMDEMAKCTHFEDTVKELTEKNQLLDIKLQQSEETAHSAVEKYEKQNEVIKKLQEDLVCASGENIKSEFEMKNAVIELEKARNDLQQSKQDIKMIKIELNEKIERSTNLEIQLLELKCSNECMKSEVDQLKEKKRIENHQNQEKNIYKETMERRLHEAFVTNNQLKSELHNILEENKELNEKLNNAFESKNNTQEEVSGLQEKLLYLQAQLNQTTSEKKHLEGKVRKVDDTKRKMEEDLKRLKENTNILQTELGKIEKQHEEALKKCINLEKDVKRKTKELEGKQRDNRRLRKELISAKEEKNLGNETIDNQSQHSDEVKELKEKIELLEKEKDDLLNSEVCRNIESNKRCQTSQQGASDSETANSNKIATFLVRHKKDVLNTALYNEIGWDFDNDTIAQETLGVVSTMKGDKKEQFEGELEMKQDLSDEVGWDLKEVTTNDDPYSKGNRESRMKLEGPEDFNALNYFQDIKADIKHSNEKIANTAAFASLTQISKEKLLLESNTARLLESKTSHLTKTQMTLEQSLSKALGENKRLHDKLNDSRIILERIKSRVSKLEEQNNVSLNGIEVETQTVLSAEFVSKATQIDIDILSANSANMVVTPEKEVTTSTKVEADALNSKAILYLTREKKQVAKELEVIKQSHEDVKKELNEQEKVGLKLKQELKTQKQLHDDEKKNLMKDLEIMRDDYNMVKIKLKEQEKNTLSCDELKEKQNQAEKLIFELEKDLMRYTEEKTSLKSKLLVCENKIKELETIEKKLQSLTKENIQMSAVQATMVKQIENYKKENKELLERLEKRRKSWNTRKKKRLEFSVVAERKKLKVQEKQKRVSAQKNKKERVLLENISFEGTDDSGDDDERNKTNEFEDEKDGDKQNESFNDKQQEKQISSTKLQRNFDVGKGVENDKLNTTEILADGNKDDTKLTREDLKEDTKENEQIVIKDNQKLREQVEHANENLAISADVETYNNTKIVLKDTGKGEDINDDCRVRDDVNSEETEEEASIELKLSHILNERHLMEHEIQSMIKEMNNLKAKFANRELDNKESSNEQDALRKKLEQLLDEKRKTEEQVKTLKKINTKNDVELSDALDEKQIMEAEIMKMKEASNEYQEKIEKVQENNTKLESMLAIVLEENSKLYKDVSTLQEENQMLKNYNIKEIVDGSTQVSPRTTEDEDDDGNILSTITVKKSLKINDETQEKKSTSQYQTPSGSPCFEKKKELSFSKGRLELPIQPRNCLAKYPCHTTTEVPIEPLSASSPEISGTKEISPPNITDYNTVPSYKANVTTDETSLQGKGIKDPNDCVYLATFPESDGGNLNCRQCHKSDCQCQTNHEEALDINSRNSSKENTTLESVGIAYDLTGGEMYTDSSFASVTDFDDISFSSDWVSAEDLRSGRVTSRGHGNINKMHREIAEIKCTNTILENELTIMKNRNSDIQAQLQKVAGKNNSLKQKLCDRSMAVKKAEREMVVLTEEKMRFEVQLSASKDEITRLERERAKLERSLSSSKSENKRLKNDLAAARADSYRTMKTLVNLEAENKKLETELEETREELKNSKQLAASMNNTSTMFVEKQSQLEEGNDSGAKESLPDRAGLTLQLTNSKPGHVKGVQNEQLFSRYMHNTRRDCISSSESDNLSSPEDYPLQQRKSQRLPCKSKSLLTAEGEVNQAYTQPLSLTQSEDSESSLSETTLKLDPRSGRTGSQMSYSSDLGFPEDRPDQDSIHSDGGTGGNSEQDDKKMPQGGIKKMFKRFSKSKKATKSSSN